MVETGGVYQVGPHILACGDLCQGNGLELIERYGQPDLCYVDPPWTASMATQYLHKAEIAGKANFSLLLTRLVECMARTKRDVFFEIGLSKSEYLLSLIEAQGGSLIDLWDTTYYRRVASELIHCSWGECEQVNNIEGMDDEKTPLACLSQVARPGDVVFDPCLGLGLTAISVSRLDNVRLLGMELNPKRLQAAMDRLSACGFEPERIGTLTSEVTDNGSQA